MTSFNKAFKLGDIVFHSRWKKEYKILEYDENHRFMVLQAAKDRYAPSFVTRPDSIFKLVKKYNTKLGKILYKHCS